MSHGIYQNSAVFSQREGQGWHGLGQVIPPEIAKDPRAIAERCGALYNVVKVPAYYRAADGSFQAVKGREFVIRDDTGEAFEAVSENRYHVDHRQPVDMFESFRDELAANKLEISHAAILHGGATVTVCATLPEDFNIDVNGKGDIVSQYVTGIIGYDKKNGAKFIDGSIRVVCQNTLNAALSQAESTGNIRSLRASHHFTGFSLKNLLKWVEQEQASLARTFDALANARMSDADIQRFFGDVLEINIEDLGRTDAKGKKLVSTKAENMLRELSAAYVNAPGAVVASGSAWGALNAVTYYATHVKTIRDTYQDGENAARVASNLLGDAAKLKLRALQLAANYAPALAVAA